MTLSTNDGKGHVNIGAEPILDRHLVPEQVLDVSSSELHLGVPIRRKGPEGSKEEDGVRGSRFTTFYVLQVQLYPKYQVIIGCDDSKLPTSFQSVIKSANCSIWFLHDGDNERIMMLQKRILGPNNSPNN